MKLVYLIISIVIIFSIMHSSFAQLISTTDIPSQESFEAGANLGSTPSTETPSQTSYELGTKQMTARSITPSQQIFELRDATSPQNAPTQTTGSGSTQMSNMRITDALKEGDALHVLVANNGTSAMNLTNWQLVTDNRNLTFTFPAFTLMPSTMVTIHTHKGNNIPSDLYGSNFMWNGTHEIKLLDNNGMLVYDYRIGVPAMK